MLNQLLQFFSIPAVLRRPSSVPAQLMERAEASAGTDPHRAAELRRAAMAYLAVVR